MKIVQMTTIPDNMIALEGQPAFYQSHNYDPLYISSPGPGLDAFGEQEGVATLGVGMQRSISPVHDMRSIRDLRRVFLQLRPEIVHAHSPKGGLLGMIAARLSGVPVRIYQIHGFPYMGLQGLKRRLLMWTERVSCLLANEVISVSPSIREVAIRDKIVPAGKISVILDGSANGVDATDRFDPSQFSASDLEEARAEFGIRSNETVVTYVGRLANDKGIAELIQAWKIVRQNTPLSRLLLVGWIDSRDPVSESILAEAEADASVILLGRRSDVPRLCAMSDLIVLPSYREGYPTVLLEAAAMAKPVVATHIPGCVDAVVDGETGILVPVREFDLLARAILRLAENPGLRMRMGEAARTRVLERFLPERVWAGYVAMYERVLADRGVAPPATGIVGVEPVDICQAD